MKDTFFGYYPPTNSEYERLWKEALLVLDTNVLLNLYRLPTAARDEFIKVLDLLKERLWVPHQVALEFQRRRLTVIASERKSTEDALESASAVVNELKRKVDALQIDKRGLGLDAKPLLEDLERANAKLVEAIASVHKAQLDIASADPIRDKLDQLLAGRVGAGPKSQAELDNLIQGGDDRFREKIPPGFADADKDKNPNEATFIHDHIKYPRKFGDLILWRQLIAHAKSVKAKSVLLVTADKKEDWWWREQGKTIGPHSELIQEIKREADVNLFWMYSSVQFLEHANKYVAATVSKEAVKEVQQVVSTAPTGPTGRSGSMAAGPEAIAYRDFNEDLQFERYNARLIKESVAAWLKQTKGNVTMNLRGFPDLLVTRGEDTHGYEVKYLRHFDRMLFSPIVVNSILRGYLEMQEGRLSAFTIVVAISERDFHDILTNNETGHLQRRLATLISRYPISGIVVGVVLGSTFEPLAWQRDAHGGEPDVPEEP